MNPWLFAFLISFILFLVLVDWRQLHINIYGGIISVAYKLIESNVAYNAGLWKHYSTWTPVNSIPFLEFVNVSSAGIAFTMGIIYFQLLPKKLGWQFVHAFIWTIFYTLLNAILQGYGLLMYVHFRVYGVTHVLIFFLSIAWFKTFWLQQENAQNLRRRYVKGNTA